jgi:hypothetical protein
MGERDVFPHVGRRTAMRLQGARSEVFPLITGTFGGVDFLHSVMGEFSDKATQSEISELEGTMTEGSQGDTSLLKDLLSSIPSGIFGGKDEASKADELQANATAAQMNQVSPEVFIISCLVIRTNYILRCCVYDVVSCSLTTSTSGLALYFSSRFFCRYSHADCVLT